MNDIDPQMRQELEQARLTPPDAEGDWGDVLRRAEPRRRRFRVPVRGTLLAAALLVGIGAGAQAGALDGLGSYFTGGSAHASKQHAAQLGTVAADLLKGAILDHKVTGETSSAAVDRVRRLVSELGTVRRVARLHSRQGVFTWYAATTPDQGSCVTLYRNTRLYSWHCNVAPPAGAFRFDVEPSGWGGGIVVIEGAVPPRVSRVEVVLHDGHVLRAHLTAGFAMLILPQPGRPFAVQAVDHAGQSLEHVVVNNPECLYLPEARAAGFGTCVASTRPEIPVQSFSWQGGNATDVGGGPAHIHLFPGWTMQCVVQQDLRPNERVSKSCQRAWERRFGQPMYDTQAPPTIPLRGLSSGSCWRITGESDYGPPVAIQPDRIAIPGTSAGRFLAATLAQFGDRAYVRGGRVGSLPRDLGPGQRARFPADARWLYLDAAFDPAPHHLSVSQGLRQAQLDWEATMIAGALRDRMCASHAGPLVGYSLRGGGRDQVQVNDWEPYPFGQWFAAPSLGTLRARVGELGERDGFAVAGIHGLRPLQLAPEVVIRAEDPRQVVANLGHIMSAIGVFRVGTSNPDVYLPLYEGYSIEVVDRHGRVVAFVGSNARGTEGSLSWVRPPLRMPSY